MITIRLIGVALCATMLFSSVTHAEVRRVVVLPANIEVYELGTTVSEKIPAWSEASEQLATAALNDILVSRPDLEPVATPELSADEQAIVDEHVALYGVVAENAIAMVSQGGAWEHKRTNFDYTVGNGLAFLADRAGADAGLVLVGYDTEATGGRIFTGFLLAATLGVGIHQGGSYVRAGLIDFRTGDVEWIAHKISGPGATFHEGEDLADMVEVMMAEYPHRTLLGERLPPATRAKIKALQSAR